MLVGGSTRIGLAALQTPLIVCSARGHVRCVDVLLSRGVLRVAMALGSDAQLAWRTDAALNASGCSARTALHAAAFEGQLDVVQRLLEQRASVRLVDAIDETPLHKAATNGRFEIAQALLAFMQQHVPRQFARLVNQPNVLQCTPIHCAAYHGHAELCRLLLECDADASIRDVFDLYPAQSAAYARHHDTAAMLHAAQHRD